MLMKFCHIGIPLILTLGSYLEGIMVFISGT